MTRTEHLLTIVAEECAEVAQRCSKALRFGLAEIQPGQPFTNAERIGMEYHDLVAAMILLARMDAGVIPDDLTTRLEAKRQKIERFLEYSRECGRLE
jgi:NTP pyrophosphatase (non-canonical NTP hydrolase)